MSMSTLYKCDVCGMESHQEMSEVWMEFEPEEISYTAKAVEIKHVCVQHNIYVVVANWMRTGFPRTKGMVCWTFKVTMPHALRNTYQREWEKGILDLSYPLKRDGNVEAE